MATKMLKNYNSFVRLMKPRRYFFIWICILTLCSGSIHAQKTLSAKRTTLAIKLDGLMNEAAWDSVMAARYFITNSPAFGNAATYPVEVKVAYDNVNLYVAAFITQDPKTIRRQMTARDQHGRADVDYFAVFLDTYKDRQNGFQFLVTTRNVQSDARLSPTSGGGWGNYGDPSWDAVWDSRVAITDKGWGVEFLIPYSAIRFSKDAIQQWGIQFMHFARSLNESNFWNPVDPNVNGFVNQFGDLTALNNIKPPLRLSFSPYLSGGYRSNPADENGDRQTEWLRSGGMDVKWGVNESFTLDATLIPDFGQVISDNVINNLSPFDIQFQENRPFFTEGTELFNKAGIFYSRRVGDRPKGYFQTESLVENNPDLELIKNPSVTPLYNAIKFSGRNKQNLGIGIFNAVAQPVSAVVRNKITGEDSSFLTEPLTNYNIVVLDKALKNRSYVTFTNTNVIRSGSAPDANVMALDFAFYDKQNTYGFFLKPRFSYIFSDDPYGGAKNIIEFGKISGKWQWSVFNNIETDRYNPNDLGFLRAPNEVQTSASVSYNEFKPTKKFLNYNYSFNVSQTYLYKPFSYQSYEVNANAFWLFKNFWDMSVDLTMSPFWGNDYFELRTDLKRLKRIPWFYTGINGSSDSRKKLFGYYSFGFAESKDVKDDMFIRGNFGMRYRFSDRLSLELSYNFQDDNGQFGYAFAREPNGEPILAFRDNLDMTTILSGIFNFTPRMNMTLRARHYWNKVVNKAFYNVDGDGYWYERPFMPGNDFNVNIFNVDVFYVWDFRLGSRIIFGYKNWIDPDYSNDIQQRPTYGKNVGRVFDLSHGNEFTLRFIYFLDVQQFKKKQSP
jgi:hypothetical protein